MSDPSPWQPSRWPAHLLALVLVGAAGLLGYWQYDAWQAQREAEATDLTLTEPVPVDEAMGPDDPFPGDSVGRPVILDGTWVPEATVLVSGRERDGVEGYWVLTPLAVGGPDAPAMPVVRGWTATTTDVPPPPEGRAELVAWLQPPEGSGIPDDDRTDDVIPEARTADLVQRVDQDLYGAYAVVADEAAPGAWPVGADAVNPGTEGLEAASLEQLPEVGRFTALRNLLYAVEWWLFGLFAAFIWWRWVQDARNVQSSPDRIPSDA
ncbi:SURF1 family protein [Nocardioides sp. GCM10027113]|uniref:SURF1 family protein n=1 Tax=unclassified Nocardioides TaxID=2615069 RepID=UPI003619D868